MFRMCVQTAEIILSELAKGHSARQWPVHPPLKLLDFLEYVLELV